ncbi:MAG: PhzF family phenazine biosynthesis protein [Bacteroidota bacterium]
MENPPKGKTLVSHNYRVVDVFTREPLQGNQLAVFPDASGMTQQTMQSIAKELNLSETTFVSPPSRADCAANVRIFTPLKEVLFAGHPTIGTAFVMIDEGMVSNNMTRFTLEEKVGPVPVRVEPGQSPLIWLTTPPVKFRNLHERQQCATVLGLEVSDLLDMEPQLVDAGNPTVFVALKDKDAVDRNPL